MIDYYEPRLDLTLLGCGFLGNYHLGAISVLEQIWPRAPYNRISGASCGGLLGALLVAGLQLDLVLDNAMNILRTLNGFVRNPTTISSVASLVERNLEKLLPFDAHLRCSGKLGVSVTKVNRQWTSKENKFISHFHSRRDLIEAICAGCFIPVWSGAIFGPQFRGETNYIDGAYSDNAPKFDDDDDDDDGHLGYDDESDAPLKPIRRVQLSPFACEVEVSPKDPWVLASYQVMGTRYQVSWRNVVRTLHAMLPFNLATYTTYLVQGHADMKQFLIRNKLIKCKQCHLLDNSLKETNNSVIENRKPCLYCLKLIETIDNLKVPKELLKIMKDVSEDRN